ncbi:MAG: tetratricopeptide repeat protein, partial [Bacteroidota bacterium]
EQANVIGSLATIASRTGKIEEALAGHAQAYALFESLNAEKSMATCDLNISYIYLMADEGEKAIPHIERSLAYYEKVDYTRGVAMGYGNLAYAFSLVGNFSAAFENYETSVAVAEENDWAGIVKDTYKDMSDTYLKAGDADQALIYFKKYHVIQDSLIGQETQQRIADLEVEFETERKEQQIIKLEQENSIQTLRMQLLIGGAVLLAVIGLLVFTRMRENLKKKQALIQKNELIHKLEKELIENQLHQKQLEQEQMEAQLAYKTKHLTDFALDIAQKNQFSNDLLLAIKGIEVGNIPKKVSDQLRQIRTFISSNLQINEELATFQQNVDEVHLEFNRKLQERYPELSQKDTILCGLLRLQLQNKEIATIRGVSDKAIKMARYRLRKKLGLKENEEITSFLKTI